MATEARERFLRFAIPDVNVSVSSKNMSRAESRDACELTFASGDDELFSFSTERAAYDQPKLAVSYVLALNVSSADIPQDHLRIWYAVKGSQAAAFNTVKAGVPTSKPDEVARTFLKALGLEEYFTHRLGHGASEGVTPIIH